MKTPTVTVALIKKLGIATNNCSYDPLRTNEDFLKTNLLEGFPICLLSSIENPSPFILELMLRLEDVEFDERGNTTYYLSPNGNEKYFETWDEQDRLVYQRTAWWQSCRQTEFFYSFDPEISIIQINKTNSIETEKYRMVLDVYGNTIKFENLIGSNLLNWSKKYDDHNNLIEFECHSHTEVNTYEYWPDGQLKRVNNMKIPYFF